jgi:hypothetical protein
MAVTPGHGPNHRGLPAQRGLKPLAGHASHDGEHPRHPDGTQDPARPFRRVGLHGQDDPGHPVAGLTQHPGFRCVHHADARELGAELLAPVGQRLDHCDLVGGDPA